MKIQVDELHELPSWEGSEVNWNSSSVICRDLLSICSHLEAPALTEAGAVVAGLAKSQSFSWGLLVSSTTFPPAQTVQMTGTRGGSLKEAFYR